MNFTMPIFSAALPEIFMLCMASLALLIDVFFSHRFRLAVYVFVQAALVITLLMVIVQFRDYVEPVITFSGHYVLDKIALLTKIFVLAISFFAFIYARRYTLDRNIARSEYYSLGIFAVLGMLVMASAYSFLTIYLGLELVTLPLYAMIALQKDSEQATEAALKYFVTGSLASGLLLYGISMAYGAMGTIEIFSLASMVPHASSIQTSLLVLGLVFILAGIIFKFGAVPFHMWVPDVYQGAPTSVTLFIASAPKIAAFCITMRILVEAFHGLYLQWDHILIAVAVLSMFFGNVLAIAQTNLKRMLAYSSIAHIGYTLLGIIAGPHSAEGYSAAMFYIVTYTLVAAGGFAVIALLSHKEHEFDEITDYRGLNARNPWLAFMMLLLMFSMAGVPPTVGFFAKLGLLEALVEAHLVWLAVLALIFAIIGAYYYLRVVMIMYFEEPKADAKSHLSLNTSSTIAITVNSLAALILGIFPSALIDLCRISLA